MAFTIPEILERLKRLDELTLIEELGLTSEDIVDRFSDIIEDQADRLEQLIDWED